MAEETTEEKMFNQEQVGRLVATAREEAKAKAEAEINAAREAERASNAEQITKLHNEQAAMSSTFDEFMRRNAENLDERTDEEKLVDEVSQLKQRLEKQAEDFQKMREEGQASYQQTVREQGLAIQYSEGVSQFEKPDYTDALAYLQDSRKREMVLVGLKNPADQAVTLKNEQAYLTELAVKEGTNPAAKIYEAAMLRGYKPKATEDNGAESVAARQKGENAQDLTGGGPTVPSGGLKALAKMSKEERDALLSAKNPDHKKNWDTLMSQFRTG